MANKVTLRYKPITNGRKSLYLDIYPPILNPKTGKLTRRDFLNIYIYEKPTTALKKEHNRETLRYAESIRQKRQNILNKPEIYNEFEKEQLKIIELGELSFIEYFKKLADKRSGSNYGSWTSTLFYLQNFAKNDIKFKDLNKQLLEEFKEYLLTAKSKRSSKSKLARNTAVSYFNKIKAALKQAYKDDILQTDLNNKVASIKEIETRREFLTIEELNQLVKTPFKNDILKRVTLFSALTGLRFANIKELKWDNLEHIQDQGYILKFRSKKSARNETLPISDQAVRLLGKTKEPEKNIFEGLIYSDYQNKQFKNWIKEAGITKKITFHCLRHTYATLQLLNKTDLYTVSKMLGHKNIKTTQIYAKIVDETKRETTNKIKLDF